jgi:tRNA-dihydrouridine synthase
MEGRRLCSKLEMFNSKTEWYWPRWREFVIQPGEHIAVKEMRKHAAWYLKGLKGSNEVRKIVNVCEAADELRHVLLAFVEEIEEMEAAS